MAGEESMVRLVGGPFDGFKIPRPGYRWAKISIEDDGDPDIMHRYRPKRDGSYIYDGTTRVVLRVPTGGAS